MHQTTQNHFLNFLYICLQESPGKITDKHMGNLKQASGEISAQVRLQNFLGQSFALQLQFTIDIFFRTSVLRKLFDIRFPYKHCNFSRICLLGKMASKTVTRSICLAKYKTISLCEVEIYRSIDLQRINVNHTNEKIEQIDLLKVSWRNLTPRKFSHFIPYI